MPLEHGLEKLLCGDLAIWPGVVTERQDRETDKDRGERYDIPYIVYSK